MKKILLVDVSSLFFRAFYALPPMYNSKGFPTNSLYGLCNTSLSLLKDKNLKYMVYCFDRKEASFRNELYEDYKKNREDMPDELSLQMPYIKKLVDALGIPRLDKKGYEADDVIGTLAQQYAKKGYDVSIISGDKDFAQLINSKITMYDPMKKVLFDPQTVKQKWGILPSQMIDYLALVGDPSDNVPGVSGIGAKTAEKLLTEHKSLNQIYKTLKHIKPSLKEKLKVGKKLAYLSKELVTIETGLKLKASLKDLEVKNFSPHLKDLFEELDFKKFKEKLYSQETPDKAVEQKPKRTKAYKNPKVLDWKYEDFKDNLKPYTSILSFFFKDQVFFSIEKNQIINFKGSFKNLNCLFKEKKITWSGFDLKEIWKALQAEEPIASQDFMLTAYVITSQSVKDFSSLCEMLLKTPLPSEPSVEEIYKAHIELESTLNKKIKDSSQKKVLEELELPLISTLYRMEQKGITIDINNFKKLEKKTAQEITVLEKKIYKESNQTFNIASPKQLSEVLFQSMGLPILKKTKTGLSTGVDVLTKLAPRYPICKYLIEYRELTKLQSTYIKALPQLAHPQTHKIHTSFKQAVTTTGRLSSVNPNLQNIPIRTFRGKEIRESFIASPKKVLLSIDYSQIELRILAHISEDKNLCEAFHKNLDIHAMTASEVFGVPLSKVSEEQRRQAKAVNFGIAYGQGVYGLSEALNIPRGYAKTIIDTYFKKFPSIKSYIHETLQKAHKLGYVETLFGRRRYIKELKSHNPALQKFGQRAAINAPMQGTASDLIKKAMIIIDGEVQAPMLLQVHDELLLECPSSQAKKIALQSKEIMESVAKFSVPLKVNISIGKNWKEAH